MAMDSTPPKAAVRVIARDPSIFLKPSSRMSTAKVAKQGNVTERTTVAMTSWRDVSARGISIPMAISLRSMPTMMAGAVSTGRPRTFLNSGAAPCHRASMAPVYSRRLMIRMPIMTRGMASAKKDFILNQSFMDQSCSGGRR